MASIPYDKFPILPPIDALSVAPAVSRVAADRDSLFQTHLRRDDAKSPPPAKNSPPTSEPKPSAPTVESAKPARPADRDDGHDDNRPVESTTNGGDSDAHPAAVESHDAGAEPVTKQDGPGEDKSGEEPAKEKEKAEALQLVANVDVGLAPVESSEPTEAEATPATSEGETATTNEGNSKPNAVATLRQRLDASPQQKAADAQLAEQHVAVEKAAAQQLAQQTAQPAIPDALASEHASANLREGGKDNAPGEGKSASRVEAVRVAEAAARQIENAATAALADATGDSTSPDSAAQRENANHQATNPAPSGGSGESATAPLSRLPQHLVGRGGERTAAAPQLNEADQARFVQRVARAFQSAQHHEGEIRLRLSPPELGSLRLEVKVQGGALTARIETETTAARQLLLDNLPVLRERLAEQGVRVEQFDVDLTDRQPGGLPDGPANEQHRDRQPGASPAQVRGENDKAANITEQHTTRRAQHDGRLNVVV